MKHGKGKRFTVGSYTFEPDWSQDLIIKWEGDTDIVHGLEPLAHLSPELDRVGPRPPLPRPDDRPRRRRRARAVHREAQPEATADRRREPAAPGLPVLGRQRPGADADGDGDAVPRRRQPRERHAAGRARQPPAGEWRRGPTAIRSATSRSTPPRRRASRGGRRGARRFGGVLRLVPGAQVGAEHVGPRAAQPALQLPTLWAAALDRGDAPPCGSGPGLPDRLGRHVEALLVRPGPLAQGIGVETGVGPACSGAPPDSPGCSARNVRMRASASSAELEPSRS